MRTFLLLGAVSAFLSVACGAFGAHGLQARLTPELLAVWKTGAEYQMYHALALLLVAAVVERLPPTGTSHARRAGWLFAIGTLFFSGSLYVLAVTGVKVLGAVTPLGGLCFLSGWASLVLAAYHIPATRKVAEKEF